MAFQSASAYGIEEAQRAETVDIACVLCHFEGNLDMGLCAEIVNLCRFDKGNDVDEICAVGEVAIMQMNIVRTCRCRGYVMEMTITKKKRFTFVLISIKVVQPPSVEAGRATNDPVHLVAFIEQELRAAKGVTSKAVVKA